MEYGEAWLLETLAIFRLPVGCMKRPERPMKEWLNRGYHKLAEEDLRKKKNEKDRHNYLTTRR